MIWVDSFQCDLVASGGAVRNGSGPVQAKGAYDDIGSGGSGGLGSVASDRPGASGIASDTV